MRILPVAEGHAYEPVTVAEFLAAVHIDEAESETVIRNLLSVAVETVEAATRRCIGARDVEFFTPAGSWRRWWVPVAPVLAVISVASEDEDFDWQDVPASGHRLARAHDEPQLVVLSHATPSRSLRVRLRVGHEDRVGTERLRQAVILLAKEWHDAGITASDMKPDALSFGVQRLIRQVRYGRPQEVA